MDGCGNIFLYMLTHALAFFDFTYYFLHLKLRTSRTTHITAHFSTHTRISTCSHAALYSSTHKQASLHIYIITCLHDLCLACLFILSALVKYSETNRECDEMILSIERVFEIGVTFISQLLILHFKICQFELQYYERHPEQCVFTICDIIIYVN